MTYWRSSSRLAVFGLGFVVMGCGEALPPDDDLIAENASALMAVDPPVSTEIEINAPELSRATSLDAKVAFGNGQYLVVWAQTTAFPSGNIFGTRITENGEILDPSGFYIGGGFPTDVVFSNGQFLVVSTSTSDSPAGDIRVARVSTEGKVLDPGGTVVAAHDGSKLRFIYPRVASNGVDFMVVWTEAIMLPEIQRTLRVARIAADGTVLDPGGRLVTEFVPWAAYPGIAFDGNQYLIAWSPNPDPLVGIRVSKSGGVLDPKPFVIDALPGNYTNVRVVHDGTNFFVAAGISQNDIPLTRIRRISADGVVDPSPIQIATPALGAKFFHLVFDGKNLLLSLGNPEQQKTFTLHLTPQGGFVEPAPVLLSENSVNPRMAANGAGAFVIFHEPIDKASATPSFAMGTRMDLDGKLLDSPPLPMSVRANLERAPRVAFNGKNYFTARQDPAGFVTAQVGPDGAILDAPVLPLPNETFGTTDMNHVTHVLSSGTSPGLTWLGIITPDPTTSAAVTGVARVSTEGTLLDPKPLLLPPSNLGPLVTHQFVAGVDPEGVMFVGQETEPNPTRKPFMVRMLNDATSSNPTYIKDEPCFPHSVTFDGTGYFVTCSTPIGDYPSSESPATLFGARLSTKGEVLAPGWKQLVTAEKTMFEWFAATFDGKNHWLFWRTQELQSGYYWPNVALTARLHALQVSPAGDVLSPEPLVIAELKGCGAAAERSLHPAVASTGGKTFVVWSEPSNPASCDAFGLDLVGVEINQAGDVSSRFTVSDDVGGEESPFIAVQPEGQALVTYARFVPEAPYGVARARARFIGTCSCVDGSACVLGQCSTEGETTDPPPTTSKGPIRFGGCDCRASREDATNGLGLGALLAGVMIGVRRRKTRRS